MMHPHGVDDPVRSIEAAIVEARRRILGMREHNFASVEAAHEAVVRIGDHIVDVFRMTDAPPLGIDP